MKNLASFSITSKTYAWQTTPLQAWGSMCRFLRCVERREAQLPCVYEAGQPTIRVAPGYA